MKNNFLQRKRSCSFEFTLALHFLKMWNKKTVNKNFMQKFLKISLWLKIGIFSRVDKKNEDYVDGIESIWSRGKIFLLTFFSFFPSYFFLYFFTSAYCVSNCLVLYCERGCKISNPTNIDQIFESFFYFNSNSNCPKAINF